MKKLLVIFAFLFGYGAFGQGAKSKDKAKIQNACDSVINKVAEGNLPEAMALLKSHSVMTSDAIDTMQATMQSQQHVILSNYGKLTGIEFIKEKSIKSVIVNRYYIMKYTDFYLKAFCTLYNSSGGWTITGFTYNENIDDLME